MQSRGINYLLPVDGVIQDEADLDLVGVQADWVLRQLFSARNRTNIVILDACRNNPFEAFAGTAERGLAEMNAPTGTFIAYASAPGSVALDGAAGVAQPVHRGALRRDPHQGRSRSSRSSGRSASPSSRRPGGRQTPWDSSSLTSEFYFRPAAPVDPRELAAGSSGSR